MTTAMPASDRVVGPLPPTVQLDDFLSPEDHSVLLAWVLANQARFKPATVTDGATHRTDDRKTLGAKPGQDRLLSAVYYFHREPKAFSGGALRLYRWGADLDAPGPDDWRDVEPRQNSLACFASWAIHEVRSVDCPSGAFEDSRFALNCWYCAAIGATSS